MAEPLDPKKIESARQFSSRAERREQRRKLMQDEIAENQRSNGVIAVSYTHLFGRKDTLSKKSFRTPS